MKLSEIKLPFTLGSKQHADAIAASGHVKLTVGAFKKAVKDSTMSQHDCDAIIDVLNSVSDNHVMMRHDFTDVAFASGVDEDELLAIAGL